MPKTLQNLRFSYVFATLPHCILRRPRLLKDGPKSAQGGSKTAPRGAKMAPRRAQDGPKTTPRRLQVASKPHSRATLGELNFTNLQDAPKIAPRPPRGAPRGPQEASKSPPRGPKRPPRGLQDAPKRPPRASKRPILVIKMSIWCGRCCIFARMRIITKLRAICRR